MKTIDAHESVCIDLDFHPIESSKVVTCSWDSSIKLWDWILKWLYNWYIKYNELIKIIL